MSDRYILVEGEPVEAPDLMEWARWMETADRHIALTRIGEVRVSTVFLGLDHGPGFGGTGAPPVLWETMIFGGPHDQAMWRYASAAEARLHHQRIVDAIRDGENPCDQL